MDISDFLCKFAAPKYYKNIIMKRKNLMLLAWPLMLLLAFASCEKVSFDESEESSSSVPSDANLVLKVVTGGTRGEEVPWTTLIFVVYQSGEKVKAVTQHVGDKQFGETGMKLTPGTYQVMVLAHSSASNPSQSDPTNVKFTNSDGFSDTFGACQDIVVEETPQTHEIKMNRMSAMVRFKTKDVKPAEAKRIRFLYTGGSGAINLLTGYGVDASTQTVFFDLPDSLIGKRLQFELYTFPRTDDAKLKLLVSMLDAKGELIGYPGAPSGIRTIEDIPVKRNQITECSGYFFTNGSGDNGDDDDDTDGNQGGNTGEDSDVSFTIVVDTKWDNVLTFGY